MVLGLVVGLALLERGSYAPLTAGMRLGAWDRLLLTWTLVAKTLWLLLPGVLASVALLRAGRTTAGPRALTALSGLALGALVVDLRIFSATGNHALTYLRAVPAGRDVLQWGGGAGSMLRPALETLLGVALGVGLLSLASDRALAARLGRRATALAAGLFLLGLLGPTLLAPTVARPLALVRLRAALPLDPPLLGSARLRQDEQVEGLNALLARHWTARHARLHAPRPLPDLAVPGSATRPNVVVLALESLRAEALGPASMPRLDAWSRRGLRLERHYASSNVSQLGLFSLLYGRGGLSYVETLQAAQPAPLVRALRQAGYTTHFVSSSRTEWHRMDQFLAPLNFDEVRVDDEGEWPDRDLRTLGRIGELLRQPGPPRFVLGFLMSTHFDYPSPPAWRRHPSALERGQEWATLVSLGSAPASLREQVHARYLNALAFLDDAVADLVEGLDPARTVVVITGDHGESFLEDGTWLHSSRLSDVQTRVPCLIAGAGVPPGRRQAWSAHTDLAPTLLHAVSGGPARGWGQGRDLLGPDPAREHDQLLLVEMTLTECVLLVGEERLQLRITPDRVLLSSEGFVDAQAGFLPELPGDPGWTERWSQAVGRELDWQLR